MPKISLIIPVYNVELYLRECLDSAVGQTLQDIEIIIVNDASPDNSRQIIADYAARDARIVALTHEHNRGLGAARNTGLERSCGEYIMFLDSDDTMEPNSCELLYRKICEHQADIVIGGIRNIDEDSRPTGKFDVVAKSKIPEESFDSQGAMKLYFNRQIGNGVWSKIYKAELWQRSHLRFHPNKLLEDSYIILDTLALSKKIIKMNTVLFNYRQRRGSIMQSPIKKEFIDGWLKTLGYQKEFLATKKEYQDLQVLFNSTSLNPTNSQSSLRRLYKRICLHPYKYKSIVIKSALPDPLFLQYWQESAAQYNLQRECCETIASAFNDLLRDAYSDKTLLKLLGQKIFIYQLYKYIKQKIDAKSV